MTFKPVIPGAVANRDVEAAIDYYLVEAAPGVALGFIDALEAAFARLSGQPISGSPRYAHEIDLPGLRVWPLRGYPYLIFYRETPEMVAVWRVLHGSRDIPASIGQPVENI